MIIKENTSDIVFNNIHMYLSSINRAAKKLRAAGAGTNEDVLLELKSIQNKLSEVFNQIDKI